ncbi:MAG: hypothetical protein O0W93_01100, partial [Methanocorpusculum sp.]|nr:hypothetical protein [Methanocorpusculum sp.]
DIDPSSLPEAEQADYGWWLTNAHHTQNRSLINDTLIQHTLEYYKLIKSPVSIRPRACFFSLFSFLPLWLHYNLNPLCVQY